jgi:alanyl-tRNA synthetase
LSDKSQYITNIVKEEEIRVNEILEDGLKIIDELFIKYKNIKKIPGDEVFKLYDTFGFPVDILQDIANENNYIIDFDGF